MKTKEDVLNLDILSQGEIPIENDLGLRLSRRILETLLDIRDLLANDTK